MAIDYREPAAWAVRDQAWYQLPCSSLPIGCDRRGNHGAWGTSNVLYASGVVETVDEGSPEWEAAMRATADPK